MYTTTNNLYEVIFHPTLVHKATMLNPKLEKQFNPHKLLTTTTVIEECCACYVFL